MVMGLSPVAITYTSNFAPASRKEFLDIEATIERVFTLRRVGDITRTYNQMHHTDNYSDNSSVPWPVSPNS